MKVTDKSVVLALALVLMALTLASCVSAPTPAPTPVTQPGGPAPTAVPKGLPTPTLQAKSPTKPEDLQRISPEELKRLIEGKADLLIVDNQPKGAYDLGHVPGAINFPWAPEIKSGGDLPKDKLLVLYCACAHEEDSSDVALQLIKLGYKNVILLDGGWLKWVELNYPQEKS